MDKKTKISVIDMLITPEWAKDILDNHNTHNRHLSQKRVDAYVEAMLQGKWIPYTNDDITFDENGILTNGQHRLHAIVKSGISQKFHVKYGVPHNPYMDKPLQRSDMNNLELAGNIPLDIITKDTMGMSAFLLQFVGCYGTVTLVHKENFLNYFENELREFVKNIKFQHCKYFSVAPIYSALFVSYLNGVSIDDLNSFHEILRTGQTIDSNAFPIIKYRNWQIENPANHRPVQIETYARCQNAIYAYVNKKTTMNPGSNRKTFSPVYVLKYKGYEYPKQG